MSSHSYPVYVKLEKPKILSETFFSIYDVIFKLDTHVATVIVSVIFQTTSKHVARQVLWIQKNKSKTMYFPQMNNNFS